MYSLLSVGESSMYSLLSVGENAMYLLLSVAENFTNSFSVGEHSI